MSFKTCTHKVINFLSYFEEVSKHIISKLTKGSTIQLEREYNFLGYLDLKYSPSNEFGHYGSKNSLR